MVQSISLSTAEYLKGSFTCQGKQKLIQIQKPVISKQQSDSQCLIFPGLANNYVTKGEGLKVIFTHTQHQ